MDVERLLDPEIAAALTALAMPPLKLNNEMLPEMREQRRSQAEAAKRSDSVQRHDIMVPGTEGDPDIRLHITRPKGAADASLGC